MIRQPALPNLIVIGAMKCGTTSLHEYLDRHPDIGLVGSATLAALVFFKDSKAVVIAYSAAFSIVYALFIARGWTLAKHGAAA